MPDWQSMFDPTLPLLELFIRGTVSFLALLALMRIVGQREAGGLGITDVLLVVLVAEAAAPGLHGDAQSVTADGHRAAEPGAVAASHKRLASSGPAYSGNTEGPPAWLRASTVGYSVSLEPLGLRGFSWSPVPVLAMGSRPELNGKEGARRFEPARGLCYANRSRACRTTCEMVA